MIDSENVWVQLSFLNLEHWEVGFLYCLLKILQSNKYVKIPMAEKDKILKSI